MMVNSLHSEFMFYYFHFCFIFVQVVFGPEKMITIPPRHYCIIENPAIKDKDGKPVVDENGQIKLLHADQVRLDIYGLSKVMSDHI